MLDKRTFRDVILEEFYRQLPEGYDLTVKETVKPNDIKMTGISLTKEGSTIGAVAYVENMYEMYRETGKEPAEIVSGYMEAIKYQNLEGLDAHVFTAEDILANCSYRMANRDTNRERLQGALIKEIPGMTDIVIYPVYEVEINGHKGTVIITEQIAEEKGLTIDQIHEAAEKHTEKRMEIIHLSERLASVIGASAEAFESPFYVSYDTANTTDEATVLGAPSILQAQTEPMYIIPSSRHELLFLPKSFEPDVEKLKALVHEVNTEVLNPEDFLSNNVYELDGGKIITHEASAEKSLTAEL
jgi:hypothetical protein